MQGWRRTVALSFFSLCSAVIAASLQASEDAAQLIGAPVIAADGEKVGEVADILLDEYDVPTWLRISMPAPLGFGARIVQIPPETYMMRDGAVVVLDLAAADIERLPDVAEPEVEK